jgi:transcription elongation factor Elf1
MAVELIPSIKSQLFPCPICGGEAAIETRETFGHPIGIIECRVCSLSLAFDVLEAVSGSTATARAVAQWNMRQAGQKKTREDFVLAALTGLMANSALTKMVGEKLDNEHAKTWIAKNAVAWGTETFKELQNG